MTTIDASALAGMTISMLERAAMVLAEEAEGPPPALQGCRFARIAYRGPSDGTLVLAGTEGFLRELAASLLGAEPDEINVESQGGDALKEMANMVGGSVIMALSGGACEYSLGLPELVGSADTPASAGGVSAQCTVTTECGALRVLWNESRAKAA